MKNYHYEVSFGTGGYGSQPRIILDTTGLFSSHSEATEAASNLRNLGYWTTVTETIYTRKWVVEEYKIWKGIDENKPVWNSRGFVHSDVMDAFDMVDYLLGNNPDLILRVERQKIDG